MSGAVPGCRLAIASSSLASEDPVIGASAAAGIGSVFVPVGEVVGGKEIEAQAAVPEPDVAFPAASRARQLQLWWFTRCSATRVHRQAATTVLRNGALWPHSTQASG